MVTGWPQLPKRDPSPPADAVEGVVERALTDARYRVRVGADRLLIAHLSSDLRLRPPRLLPGSRVLIQIASRNPSRGRIVACVDPGHP